MKSLFWNVTIYNPIDKSNILEQNKFKTIEEIYNKYPNIPLNTWRNICIGRSKIYNKFITIERFKIITPEQQQIQNLLIKTI